MATTMRLKGGVPILEPHGKIVGPAVSELREKLALELLEASHTPCFLINFEHVHKIDSSGLGMLVNVHVIAAQLKSRIAIINVGRHIKSLLVLSRLVNIFEHFESEEAAILALAKDD